jgi:hypothetical protein
MVSRQDQTFAKLNWFRLGEPLFIYLFHFVSHHIVIVTRCNMQIKQIIRYAEQVCTKDVERETER